VNRVGLVVLYEDSRGQTKDFGPHELLLALVADDTRADFWHLRGRVDGRPLRGIGNVVKAIKDLDRLSPSGGKVLLIVDGDHIRETLSLPREADGAEIERALARRSSHPARVVVRVLHQNIESLLAAARDCDPSLGAQEVEAALRRKDVNARDAILVRIARSEHLRAVRDCIRREMPSFASAADALAALLAA
jgi:hypothetical protein